MRLFLPGFAKRRMKEVRSRLVAWLREWTKPEQHSLASGAVADATHSKSELMLENALLRQQLIVLERQVKRSQVSWRERGIIVVLDSKLRGWKDALFIVQPETVLRWHRDLFRLVWQSKSQNKQQGERPTVGPKQALARAIPPLEQPRWPLATNARSE